MGFLVRLKTRNGSEEVIIRGNDDSTVDFVRQIEGEKGITYNPYKFFTTIDSALDRLFRMRCNNRDAETIQELLANVREERELLKKEFEGLTQTTQRKRG